MALKWVENEMFFEVCGQLGTGLWSAMGSGNFKFSIPIQKVRLRFRALGWGLMIEEGFIWCMDGDQIVGNG